MARTHPRWKRELPRRPLDHRGRRPRRGAQATLRKPPAAPAAGAGVQWWLPRVGSLTTGVQKVLGRHPGGGVGSARRCS